MLPENRMFFGAAVQSIDPVNLEAWRELNERALAAHAAFVAAARGSALARHRGDQRRSETLANLARKQHDRWAKLSAEMQRLES